MVKNYLEILLNEVGKSLNIPDLHPDRNNSCLINMPEGIQIQLEQNPRTEDFIIGADLGQVPQGRYREDLFREALKANGKPFPQHGILAYSSKNDHLVLYETFHKHDLRGDQIADEIPHFVEKAKIWKESMEKGEIPVVGGMKTSMGMFGLRP
jgi:hypothetical protein